jgi:sugar phosphate isomerase/epimerase
MKMPLGVQLYSVRESAAKDFPATLKKIAEIGYKYVEPAGFFSLTPSEFVKVCADLGLKICSSHSPWVRSADQVGEATDIAGILGLKTVVCGWGPDQFKDLDSIKRTADLVSDLRQRLAANGLTLFQHNHYWEFERLDGRVKYDIFRELCPGLKYEIDCFWSTNKGAEDPVEMLKPFVKDTILLHMKDGVCRQQATNAGMKDGLLDMKVDLLPLGSGDLPIKTLVETATESKAMIVELDYCESMEMLKALEISYNYIVSNGIAQ